MRATAMVDGFVFLAAALLLGVMAFGCSHTVDVAQKRDAQAAAVEQQHEEQRAVEQQHEEQRETVTAAPVREVIVTTTHVDAVPATPTRAARPARTVTVRRVIERGPVVREVDTRAAAVTHVDQRAAKTVVAHSEQHFEQHEHRKTSTSFGFQLWLVLMPVGLLALVCVVFRLRRSLPWIP